MKKSLLTIIAALCCTVMANAESIPTNEIWYTSTDGRKVEPYNKEAFGADINESGSIVGIIRFSFTVISIGKDAFKDCNTLASITLPSYVKSIGANAFYNCKSLVSISIPNSVESIGSNAFCGCESLTSINIPVPVKSIENMAFSCCYNLTTVSFDGIAPTFGNGVFFSSNNLKYIVVQNSQVDNYKNNGALSAFADKIISLSEFKSIAEGEINKLKESASSLLSNDDKTAISQYISNLMSATTPGSAVAIKEEALAFIHHRAAVAAAFAEIDALISGVTDEEILSKAQTAKNQILNTDKPEVINSIKEAVLNELKIPVKYFNSGKSSALGTMGTEQEGPAVEVKGKDGSTVKLYNIENVKFSKEETQK
ncbi:MAG: leucine-rich repeat domain-containing protein [Bacteroidaceae bacterium]|nr:leucine-rich repeat domain-containing protein [Bacteroidaceae bacterium]